jgi:hypothetical protein
VEDVRQATVAKTPATITLPLAQLRAREIALGDAKQRTSGVAFLALVLALGASLAGGYLGQGKDMMRAGAKSKP